ncbi:kinesin-like protein Klp61F [Drosophila miranda]|uniref:kinesin-like protein Klp61F n=1 Tax=Drosophila miranda TaxID=7229 RepID=UPI00143F9857|nr:kinesin-like protein Klp61F [Drosophila miranda]
MDTSNNVRLQLQQQQARKSNQNIQVYVRVRPLNARKRCIRSAEVVDVLNPREILTASPHPRLEVDEEVYV